MMHSPNRTFHLGEAANLAMNEPCSRARHRPLPNLSGERQRKMQQKRPHWELLCRQHLRRMSLYVSEAAGAVAVN